MVAFGALDHTEQSSILPTIKEHASIDLDPRRPAPSPQAVVEAGAGTVETGAPPEGASAHFRRLTLAGQIADHVRDLVLEGSLRPGSRVVEAELGRRLGVSRTPLREALKLLAGEGLIDIVPSRGAVVHKINAEQARHLLEIVTGLEALAAPLACMRGMDEEIDAIQRLHLRLEQHFNAGERLEYYKVNLAVHGAIVQAAHNPELSALHGRFSARLKLIRFSGASKPEQWRRAVDEHKAIAEALAARDGQRLARLLTNHLELIWERVGAHV